MGTGFFAPPQPSFHDQHSVTHVGSTVSAQYDIEIMQNMAEYNIQTQISCGNVQGDIPRCGASGRIFMTPSTDVWIEMTSTYHYSLASDLMGANARINAVSADLSMVFISDGGNDATVSQPPHSGVFNMHGAALIPAGTVTRIEYAFDTRFLTGSANIAALSTGSLHMTMTAVPEPSALMLLAAGIGVVSRRRRHR